MFDPVRRHRSKASCSGSTWRRGSLLFSLALLTLALVPAGAQAVSRVSADFNADGNADLAVGAPGEDVGSVSNAGAVNVIYGTLGSGLGSTGNQLWHQDMDAIADSAEESDAFGASLAAGDFDGDGADDLAVGVLNESVGTVSDAGAVNVIYGTPGGGLKSTGNQFWHQASPGILDGAETSDDFGVSLAAGDFDNDGADDLAVGTWREDVGSATDAGAVNVIYGTPGGGAGLSASGDQIWHQDIAGIDDAAEDGDVLGFALTAGDFDGDKADDLAAGVFGESLGVAFTSSAGAVNVIYGTPGGGAGLTSADDQVWHQNIAGIRGVAEGGDSLGASLAAGDFDRDGADDLAAGVPLDDAGLPRGSGRPGAVNVIYGTPGGGAGLAPADDQIWHQDSAEILEKAERFDLFGSALTAGDFDGDGADDLAAGVPWEDRSATNAGAVNAIYGTPGGGAGLSPGGNQIWHQDSPGILDGAEAFDNFGGPLSTGDFDGNGADDLAAGVPEEDLGPATSAGAVNAIYGTPGGGAGLTASGDQIWHQDIAGILEEAEGGEHFGSALPSGSRWGLFF
jgi:FG-GAP repeat